MDGGRAGFKDIICGDAVINLNTDDFDVNAATAEVDTEFDDNLMAAVFNFDDSGGDDDDGDLYGGLPEAAAPLVGVEAGTVSPFQSEISQPPVSASFSKLSRIAVS